MGATVVECREMISAAARAERTLAVDFESRLIPHYRRIRQWIDDGVLGAVRAVHIDHFWDGHKPDGPLGERRSNSFLIRFARLNLPRILGIERISPLCWTGLRGPSGEANRCRPKWQAAKMA